MSSEADARMRPAEREVRTLLDDYFNAIRASDLEAITAHYAPDVVAFDAIAELEFSGLAAYRAHWKACLDMCEHMVFEPREPTIRVGDDLALAHCLIHCGGTGPDGTVQTGWMRSTIAARKKDGQWRIVHEHYSMPFDPVSGRILGELAP